MRKRMARRSIVLLSLGLCVLGLWPMVPQTGMMSHTQIRKPIQHNYTRKLPPVQTSVSRNLFVLGYYTGYFGNDKKSYDDLVNHVRHYKAIASMNFSFRSDASIVGSAPERGIQYAETHRVQTYAVVANTVNDGFAPKLAHRVLHSTALSNKLVNNIVSKAKSDRYAGVDIDFENLPAGDRGAFTNFISQLSRALHHSEMKLIVSVPAKTSDSPESSWVGAYDYSKLGQFVDLLGLMTYDENGPWGPSGPVASYGWVDSVLRYATSHVNANRILMGMAAYGYDWDTTHPKKNQAVAWDQTGVLSKQEHATPVWDSSAQSPYFSFTAVNGDKHVVWYENKASIQAKYRLAAAYKIAGISIWHMGLEDASFWESLGFI